MQRFLFTLLALIMMSGKCIAQRQSLDSLGTCYIQVGIEQNTELHAKAKMRSFNQKEFLEGMGKNDLGREQMKIIKRL